MSNVDLDVRDSHQQNSGHLESLDIMNSLGPFLDVASLAHFPLLARNVTLKVKKTNKSSSRGLDWDKLKPCHVGQAALPSGIGGISPKMSVTLGSSSNGHMKPHH